MAEKKGKAEKKVDRVVHSAPDRCRAVLSVWTERRKPSQVCRELSIPWVVLNQWEKRALEGMLTALQPRKRQEVRAELSPRLVKLMERKEEKQETIQSRLEKRLEKIQSSTCGKEEKPSPK